MSEKAASQTIKRAHEKWAHEDRNQFNKYAQDAMRAKTADLGSAASLGVVAALEHVRQHTSHRM